MNDSEKLTRNRTGMKYVAVATVALLVLCLAVVCVAAGCELLSDTVYFTMEAGGEFPSATEVCGRIGASYSEGFDPDNYAVPGEYELEILVGNRTFTLKLTVEDTRPPKGKLLALSVNKNGPFPGAEDFFDELWDASGIEAEFLNMDVIAEALANPALKEYEVQISLSDPLGNSRKYKTTMRIVEDTTPPVIRAETLSGYVGEAVPYRKSIEAIDNCFGPVTLTIDDSDVDINKAGRYVVTVTAKDAAGNVATADVDVIIEAERVTENTLDEKLRSLIESGKVAISENMSTEMKVKAIYAFVNSPDKSAQNANIRFVDKSNTDRSDWRSEAYLTLESGQGDCYSYFAVSKAFFEYLGIENRDIERDGPTTQSGTHFWSIVNIGTEKKPKWYYFDATRLAGSFPDGTKNGCLRTLDDLENYRTSKGDYDFYSFNDTKYPTAETTGVSH